VTRTRVGYVVFKLDYPSMYQTLSTPYRQCTTVAHTLTPINMSYITYSTLLLAIETCSMPAPAKALAAAGKDTFIPLVTTPAPGYRTVTPYRRQNSFDAHISQVAGLDICINPEKRQWYPLRDVARLLWPRAASPLPLGNSSAPAWGTPSYRSRGGRLCPPRR
jgi:hypothetical protein